MLTPIARHIVQYAYSTSLASCESDYIYSIETRSISVVCYVRVVIIGHSISMASYSERL